MDTSSSSTCATYVWLGADPNSSGKDLHDKMRVIERDAFAPFAPDWNYDGSSTGQADCATSEMILKPVRHYKDPFGGKNDVLVLCDAVRAHDNSCGIGNYRSQLLSTFESLNGANEAWFGLEQEYVLFSGDRPLGWPKARKSDPSKDKNYYCAVGADVSCGREIVREHAALCLAAGIKLAGTNAEVMLGQWEFQIGPCDALRVSDDLWMARYLLIRVAERHDVVVNFEPKPIKGNKWNGSGCHANYSTAAMRAPGGYKHILAAMKPLEDAHEKHIAVYGDGNDDRLTGKCETARIDEFRWGVGDRGASIRIPTACANEKCGYLEDRRPASNSDPYRVTNALLQTTLN